MLVDRAKHVVREMGDMSLADLWDLMERILVSDPTVDYSDGTLAATIRGPFSSDDDYDDFRHEIEHELGHCNDMRTDCMWYDGDDDEE